MRGAGYRDPVNERGPLRDVECHPGSVVLRLRQAKPIPERILEHRLHAVELIFRFGDELHAFGLQFFKGLATNLSAGLSKTAKGTPSANGTDEVAAFFPHT